MKDISIRLTEQDKKQLDNLIRVLGRAKIELEGAEILVAADAMRWMSRFQKTIEEEARKPSIQVSQESPIKQESKPKKASKDK